MQDKQRPLLVRMLTSWVTTVCLLVMVVTLGAISYHKYQTKKATIAKDPMTQQWDSEFRACVRKAAGVVNVASLDQIQACTKQTSVPLQEPKTAKDCIQNPIYPFGGLKEFCY